MLHPNWEWSRTVGFDDTVQMGSPFCWSWENLENLWKSFGNNWNSEKVKKQFLGLGLHIPPGCLSNPRFNGSCSWPFISSHKSHHFWSVSFDCVSVFSKMLGAHLSWHSLKTTQNRSGSHFFLHSLLFTKVGSSEGKLSFPTPRPHITPPCVWKCKRTGSSVAWTLLAHPTPTHPSEPPPTPTPTPL